MAGLDSFSSSLPIDTVTKPLLDNLHLRAAFNIASAGIDLPDITVQLGDYEWRLHKSVICENSGFFRRALEGRFRVRLHKAIVPGICFSQCAHRKLTRRLLPCTRMSPSPLGVRSSSCTSRSTRSFLSSTHRRRILWIRSTYKP